MINYSIPEYSFNLGGFELSKFIIDFDLRYPEAQITAPQTRSGQFQVQAALATTGEDLDDQLYPERWEDEQQQLVISFYGTVHFTGYIRKYRYNPKTRVGMGEIIGQIGSLSFDRKSFNLDAIPVGVGISVGAAVKALILESAKVNGVQTFSDIAQPTLTGSIDVPFTSENPIADAQKFTGVDRLWVYEDPLGGIRFTKFPLEGTPLFIRSLNQVESEPDLIVQHVKYQNLIVYGNKSILVPNPNYTGTTDAPKVVKALFKDAYARFIPAIGFPGQLATIDGNTIPRDYPDETEIIIEQIEVVREIDASRKITKVITTYKSCYCFNWALPHERIAQLNGTFKVRYLDQIYDGKPLKASTLVITKRVTETADQVIVEKPNVALRPGFYISAYPVS